MTPRPKLHESAKCPHCSGGWLRVERPSESPMYKGTLVSMAVRCLCDVGARLSQGRRADEILTPEEIAALWPDGRPNTDLSLFDRLREAGVPEACLQWSLQSYLDRVGHQPLVVRARTWATTPIDKRPDIVLFGPHGTGKTGLAIALLREISRERIHYTDARKLWMRWQKSFSSNESEMDVVDEFESYHVLAVDELTSSEPTPKQLDFFRLLLDARQKALRSTVLVCNMPPTASAGNVAEHLTNTFGPTIYDRLRERAQFWAVLGDSQRKTLAI